MLIVTFRTKHICYCSLVQTNHGEAAFSFWAPQSWNKISEDIRLIPTLTTFKSRSKTCMLRTALTETYILTLSHLALLSCIYVSIFLLFKIYFQCFYVVFLPFVKLLMHHGKYVSKSLCMLVLYNNNSMLCNHLLFMDRYYLSSTYLFAFLHMRDFQSLIL